MNLTLAAFSQALFGEVVIDRLVLREPNRPVESFPFFALLPIHPPTYPNI